ncbi:MAG: MFS transporter [Peptococcaceae bacterium]|nr:MFS transporter [Peptococcaceae bacterium]
MSEPTAIKKPHYGPVVKAAVLSIMLLQYLQALTTPAAGAILAHFEQYGYTSLDIKQIQTIPTLVMIFACMAIIPMARKMRKKTILKIAMALIFFGGITPAFGPDSLPFIYACRVVFGCGYGMIYSLASSFIVDLFDGAEEKQMMGWKTAAGSVGGIIFQTVGGILAAIYWKYAFLGFLAALPFILLILWKCPDPSDLELQAGAKPAEAPKAPVERGHWFVIILAAFNVMIFSSFMTNMPICIMKEGLGDPNTVALVMNIFTVGIFIGSFTYGWTTKIMKRFDIPITILLYGIILVLLPRIVTLPFYMFAAFVFGFAFGTYNPSLVLAVSRQGNPLAATSAIALFVAGQGVGQFLQPYFLLLTGVFGLNEPWGELAPWVLAGPMLLIIAVCSFIWVAKVTNKKFPYEMDSKAAAK